MTVMDIVEKNWLPDALVRAGIRRQLRTRLRSLKQEAGTDPEGLVERFTDELNRMPLAVHTEEANRQHYELPSGFFENVLGPRLKYSSALWEQGVRTLGEAEELMLERYLNRALIKPGHRVLDLGCGWGSFSLYLAGKHPECEVTAVSNSASQRAFIEKRACDRGLKNLHVITADVRDLETDRQFDRIVSVEMFEHLKNYRSLFEKISNWLTPDGLLFVHVFVHERYPYHFDADDESEWMARHFFTGGLMPSFDLLPRFQEDLKLDGSWRVSGTHYEKTANAWLDNLDAARERITPILVRVYGEEAARWWGRWRLFFMACAELFGYDGGKQWHVAHYRFRQRTARDVDLQRAPGVSHP